MKTRRVNVAIYGAGSSGLKLAKVLAKSQVYCPVLFIDDNPSLQKSSLEELSIYSFDELSCLVNHFHLKELLLAIPSVEKERRWSILRKVENLSLHVRSIPSEKELRSGRLISELKELDISDLLRCSIESPDQMVLRQFVQNKRVMVTGAGGVIGSELCRQIVKLAPTKLILFDVSECFLCKIESELIELCRNKGFSVEVIPVLGSIQNYSHIIETIHEYNIQDIYHAAAYKHEALLELNLVEGIKNNVLGAIRTAMAAHEAQIERFILISTSKKVSKTSTMVTSKYLAELGLQALSGLPGNTVFSAVRFGNIIDCFLVDTLSIFRKKLDSADTITVTQKNIVYDLMSASEVAQLVIQSCGVAKGGEVYLLDSSESVRLVDLLRRIIRFSGFKEHEEAGRDSCISIEFSNKERSKLYSVSLQSEEQHIDESTFKTSDARISTISAQKLSWHEYQEIIDSITSACNRRDINKLLSILKFYTSFKRHKAGRNSNVVDLPMNQ